MDDPKFSKKNFDRYSSRVRELEDTVDTLSRDSGSLRPFAQYLFSEGGETVIGDYSHALPQVTNIYPFYRRDQIVFRLLGGSRFDVLDMWAITNSEFPSDKLYSMLVGKGSGNDWTNRKFVEANNHKVPHFYKAHSGGQALDGPWWKDVKKMIEEVPADFAKYNEERLKIVTDGRERMQLAHQVACDAYKLNQK